MLLASESTARIIQRLRRNDPRVKKHTTRRKRRVREDSLGERFGRLVVVDISTRAGYLMVRCDCGEAKEVALDCLRSGSTRSCGCSRRGPSPNRTHGMRNTRTYRIWASMKDRCTNPKCNRWQYYGGRGITVCERWLSSFQNFLEDMGHCPPDMSLERKDSDAGYVKDNCCWADSITQANNKRNNVKFTFNGENFTLPQWSRKTGIPYGALRFRLRAGWTIQQMLTTPAQRVLVSTDVLRRINVLNNALDEVLC